MRRLAILGLLVLGGTASPVAASHTCGLPTSATVADFAALLNADDTFGCHDGTLQGGTAFQRSAVDFGFSFDGVDDYVSVPDAPIWNFGAADFRIDVVGVVFRAYGGSDPLHPCCILVASDEGPSTRNKWIFSAGANSLIFLVDGPSVPRTTITAPFTPQLGVAYDLTVARLSGVYQFRVGGVLVGATANGLTIPDAAAPLTIGQGESMGYLNGVIDGVRISR